MKKFLKILLLIIIIIPILYTLIFFIQNYSIKKSFESEYISSDQSYIIETKLLKCNLNIFQPEFVRVTEFEDRAEKRLSFYKPIHLFSQSNEEWRNSRIGGTTVKNTTFPELVEMVKEDCSQFQQSKGNHTDETVNWSYSEYIPEPEPVELSPEQQAIKERWELGKELRLELSWMTEEEKKYVEEKYGITLYSSMDELLEWHKKAVEDGFFKY